MTVQYPPSDKQLNFIATLLRDRDVPDDWCDMAQQAQKNDDFDMRKASNLIGELMKFPMRSRTTPDDVHHAAISEDGMYRTSDGTIYKVQYNKASGDGRRMYAKRLCQNTAMDDTYNTRTKQDRSWRFEYAPGAMRTLTPADKMTLEQAKEFGALYGTCCVCGRTLTDEVSIEAGIGPVCAGRYFAR